MPIGAVPDVARPIDRRRWRAGPTGAGLVGAARAAALAAALAGCVTAEAPPAEPEVDDPAYAAELAEGCGGVIADPDAYAALPLIVAPPSSFVLAVLDVGQGDAAVVRTPSGCAALFDGGPSGMAPVIKANLAELGVTRLDAAFLSHYHADHLGSLDDVERGAGAVPIAIVYDRGGSYTTNVYDQYAAQFAGRRATAVVGQVIDLCGEVTLTVVAVAGNGVASDDENALSVAVKVSYGRLDALIGGDLTGRTPDIEALAAPAIGAVELYKVHHHGSVTSTSAGLMAALRPTASFISLGASNGFGHPAPATIQTLDDVSAAVWMTENPATGGKGGPIVVTSTGGDSYRIAQGAAEVAYRSKGVIDTGPPTAPTDVVATATPTAVSLTWTAADDDLGVVGYLVERDGLVIAQPTGAGFVDAPLAPGATHGYRVAARDADGGVSPSSATVTVTTPCALAITDRTWDPGRRELTVRATSSAAATLTLRADAAPLGPMVRGFGAYTARAALAARPACVDVIASCGGRARRCF